MAVPRICVLRAPGTNCDIETAYAFRLCGAEAERVHLFRLLERPQRLARYQVLCVPGGFSYGDDIGGGVIFSRKLRLRLGEAMAEFLQADKLALGICNGFQVLLKAGVLPDGAAGWSASQPRQPQATLTWNDNGKYTALWVRLRVAAEGSVFLRGIEEIELPVAHAEGRFIVKDEALLGRWRQAGQIALEYGRRDTSPGQSREAGRGGQAGSGSQAGGGTLPYPHNPNGSVANIAGMCDSGGRVLGLMPHPERFLFATQHPRWTRLRLEGEGGGLRLFRNAVEYFA